MHSLFMLAKEFAAVAAEHALDSPRPPIAMFGLRGAHGVNGFEQRPTYLEFHQDRS